STGALYHIELYVVCGDLQDPAGGDRPALAAGVYHFGVHDFALRRLRAGEYHPALVRASGGEPSIAAAPAVIVCTTTYWRNAWKYRARAYRHAFWDSGTMLANLLAASAGYGVPTRIVCGFVDAEVNHLLDLDTEREVAIALIALGRDGASPGAAGSITASGTGSTSLLAPALGLATEPLSKSEVDYPAIRAVHAASSLHSVDEATAWRRAASEAAQETPGRMAPLAGQLIALQRPTDSEPPSHSIAQVIRRRGSTRQFARKPITFPLLSTILDRSTRGIPADSLGTPEQPTRTAAMLNTLYLIVHAVEGLTPGAYVFHRDIGALELLKDGDFRQHAGYLDLEQELAADASINVYFLADLRLILQRLGNRGYRAAQLDAAITGGKLYLAAYTLRLGASGLTFYDDDVTEFFSPHAAGKSVMFLIALGKPAPKTRG
ncbi:MAG: SagB/ThcOx family dehydrogenase, partial [bacterium]